MEQIKDYEDRIRIAGYKLGGQIKVLDNGVDYAKDTIALCERLLANMNYYLKRGVKEDIDKMVAELKTKLDGLVYASNRAIEQNSNVRSILEKGINNEY